MAIRPDYTIGTLTLTSGSANFTTSGSALQTAAVQAGDAIITRSGDVLIIAAITGQNSGTLFLPCPASAAGAGQPLRIRFQPDGSRYQGAVRNLIDLLSSGNVEAFAGLTGTAGKVPVFTGPGAMNLRDYIADPNGSLGKLATLTLAVNKAITTDGSGNAQQSDLGTLGRILLALTTGTNAQYVQGDGTLQTKAGLPVSAATQSALDAKANKSGDVFSGLVTVSHASATTARFDRTRPTSEGAQQGGLVTLGYSNDANFSATMYMTGLVGSYTSCNFRVTWGSTNQFFAMRSDGSFTAPGAINGSAKNFEIDHPSDPLNYDMRHCAIEAPRMEVTYTGVVQLVHGKATVNVEDHFGVKTNAFLNLWIEQEVTNLQIQDSFDRVKCSRIDGVTFDIECENQNSDAFVVWTVTARRNDPYVRWDGCTFTDSDGNLIIEFEKQEPENA